MTETTTKTDKRFTYHGTIAADSVKVKTAANGDIRATYHLTRPTGAKKICVAFGAERVAKVQELAAAGVEVAVWGFHKAVAFTGADSKAVKYDEVNTLTIKTVDEKRTERAAYKAAKATQAA